MKYNFLVEKFVRLLVRPRRKEYSMKELGPPKMTFHNLSVHRKDEILTNKRN